MCMDLNTIEFLFELSTIFIFDRDYLSKHEEQFDFQQ